MARKDLPEAETPKSGGELKRWRDALLLFFEDKKALRIVVSDCGMQPNRIDWDGSLKEVLDDVLRKAALDANLLRSFLEEILERYPNRPTLLELKASPLAPC